MQTSYTERYSAGILIPMKKTLEQLALLYNLQITIAESGWLVKDGVFRVTGDSRDITTFRMHIWEWVHRVSKD